MGERMYRSTLFLTWALNDVEWSVSHPGRRTSGTYWIEVWVISRANADDMEKRKFFTLPGLEV
jgi:hypothetical protein